jgi:hypothetical protein
MTREPLPFRHRLISAGGVYSRRAFRSVEVGRDSEKTQQRSDLQIVHVCRVQNLAPDLIRSCAHWLRARPVEEQFLVRPRPSAELFLERGKSMLRDQDQGARYTDRVRPAVRLVEICERRSFSFLWQNFTQAFIEILIKQL